jgi:hypothetical protein
VATLGLTLQSPVLAGPAPDPHAQAPPGGQRDERAPVRVVLVRPADADAITAEALVRIQGELVAEGFSVALVDAPATVPGRPPEGRCERGAGAPPGGSLGVDEGAASGPVLRGDVAPAAPPDRPSGAGAPLDRASGAETPLDRSSGADRPSGAGGSLDRPSGAGAPADAEAAQASAVSIKLSLDTSTHVAELVITDRLQNKKLTRWIDTRDAPPDHLAEVLAVRAVELVRASLVELALPGARPPAAKVPAPSWGLEAGTSVLVSPRAVGPAALAFTRLRFAPIRRLELRLAFAGLGTSPRVQGPDGASARVTQLLALSEVALRPWPDLRVRPSFSLGAGALEVSAEGEAPAPYRGTEAAMWAALLGGGVGAEVLVGPHFSVAAEVRAFAAIPYPSVRFLGTEAARVALPGLLAALTLVGWL